MPALRVILVRLFPRILGTSINTSHHAKYGNRSQDLGKSGFSSQLSKKSATGNVSAINYTKTFEVRHGEDEVELVQMHDTGTKGKITSAHSSEISL